jgi:hypothetical protein
MMPPSVILEPQPLQRGADKELQVAQTILSEAVTYEPVTGWWHLEQTKQAA